MKAAVLHQLGHAPKYDDFPDPIAQNGDQVVLSMKAAPIKNLDKGRASGAHYAPHTHLPEVVGTDGVGVTPDGKRVYATGISGMIAEKALVDKHKLIPVPADLDDSTAAALPNTIMGAGLALKYRAGMAPGKVVLINGATGATGKVAVQLAKYYGAARVIATGRNETSLKSLPALGADDVLSLGQGHEGFTDALHDIHSRTPIDIIIDYTWGSPVEWILGTLKGAGMQTAYHPIRLVTVGNMANENITLPSSLLRSSAIEIVGSGFGSLPRETFEKLNSELIPEMMKLAAAGKLRIDTETVPLRDIEKAWNAHAVTGARRVVLI